MVLSWPVAGIAGAGFVVVGILWWRARRTTQSLADAAQSARAVTDTLQAKIDGLETGRAQLTGILQSMTEGVLAVGPRGELWLMNPAAAEILGAERWAAPGGSARDLVRQPELQEVLQQTLATGTPQVRDVTLYAPTERSLRVRAASCQGPSAARGALLVLHDITDLKHLEHLRRDFVANVSHELKTPLTAIQGAVETLLDGALNDPAHNRAFAAAIAEEATRLQRLVDDLLTLAEVEASRAPARREPIAVARFLDEQAARYQPLAAAHQVTVTVQPPPETLRIEADRQQLAQAIGNLLDNAIKYNRHGGRVTVTAAAAGDGVRFEVDDTGVGVPTEDLPRIFERFYRVDKARSRETGGTGLGLSIVKHVAEQHGGSVAVDSQPGRGSRFTLILPRA